MKLFGMFLGMYKSKKPLRAYIDNTSGGDEKIRTSDPGFAQMLP